jgi:hypothetical protein
MFKIQYLVLNEGQAVSNEYVDTEFEYKDLKDAEKKRIELQDYYTDSRWYRIVKFVENV